MSSSVKFNSVLRQYGRLAAALLIAIAAAWPVLAEPGLLNTRGGGDSPFLLQRLHQLETALRDGHFPVRWMPDANYGYGYPFYNFYAPLSIYITAVFRLIGFSYIRSIELSQLLGFVTAAAGMYVLARRWFGGDWAGLLAAAAYTVAPFHLVNVYVRGDSLAEFWAMAFYPLVILAADNLLNRRGRRERREKKGVAQGGWGRQIAWLGLAYAGLILSHNISALIFSPFLLLYLLLQSPKVGDHRQTSLPQAQTKDQKISASSALSAVKFPLLPIIISIILALTLAAWFFIPALAEQNLAQLDTVTAGYFHYGNHFLGGEQLSLVQPAFFFDFDVEGRSAFRLGLVQMITIAAGALALLVVWRREQFGSGPVRLFILLTLLVSAFMLTPLSDWLWQHLPLLAFTQFPWRFLSVLAFGGALATAVLSQLPGRRLLVPFLVGLLLVANLGRLQTDHLPLTDADVTAEKLAQYEWFTGNIGTTVSFEYLPPTVQPRPYTSPWLETGQRWQVRALSGSVEEAALTARQATSQSWQIRTAVPSTLLFPTLHWPGWQATVNGEPVAIRPSPGSGLILLDVPAGTHTVSLRLGRTPIRLAAELLSLTAVLVTLWLLRPRAWPRPGRKTAVLLAGLALLVIVVRLWPQPALSPNTLTWDFAQMGYLHHDSGGVLFDNGARLAGYTFDKETASAGETVTIILNWETMPAPTTATLSLNNPAVNRPMGDATPPPPLATQTQTAQIGRTVFRLALPDNAPAGLVAPHLTLADGRPLLPSGGKRGDLFLRPIRIVNDQPAAVVKRPLDVQALQVQMNDGVLNVQLAWLTQEPLSRNYNVSLRLMDAQGRFLRLVDIQPGYGFRPSSLWPAGEWVNDWLALPLPPDQHQFPYVLAAQLYDVAAPETAVLTRRLGELHPEGDTLTFRPATPSFTVPAGIEPATAVFGDQIQLRGYTLDQNEDTLDVTLVWQALSEGQTDYIRFVHLIVPTTDAPPLTQDDSIPRYGSYPTSQWTTDEVVSDALTLDLTDIPPGMYRLAVGFYERWADGSLPRLTAVGPDAIPLPDNRFLLPTPVTIGQ